MRLRGVAALRLQALNPSAELIDAILGVCNSLGNCYKRVAVSDHVSTLWIIVPGRWVQRVYVEAKKALCQSKDTRSACNQKKKARDASARCCLRQLLLFLVGGDEVDGCGSL